MRHVRRLCQLALSLSCFAVLATTPAAQGQAQIDTRLRIVDAKTNDAQPENAYILRGGDGLVITPQTQDGEMSFLMQGRKLIVEPVAKGAKTIAQSFILIDAPEVHVTLCVDSLSGRVVEVRQKPVFAQARPRKIGRPGSGQIGFVVPPVNDNCATPSVIANGATAFNTADATTDGPSNCSGQVNRDIWYDYTATGTGVLTVSTCNAATFDTKIAIYNGLTCPPGAPIGCNDDFGGCAGFTSTATAPVVLGSHYLIRVGAFGSTTTGTGTITITAPAGPPAFDECAGATSASCNSSTMFNNSAATTNGTDPLYSCRFGGPGQGFGTSWFSFMAIGPSATIDTNGSSTGDTLLGVYSGTCGALTEIGCDDDSGTGLLSLVNVAGLTVGQTYYIQVSGFFSGNVGNNVLNIACIAGPPPGDACADAIEIPCNGSDTVNNTTFVTEASDPAYSCRFGGPGQGIGTAWFKFEATHTSAHIDTEGSTAFDTLLAVYDGTCGAFVELACDDDTGTGLLSDLCVEGLTIGQLYYIQASSFSAFDTGDITVNVECPCPLPPANDACEDAIALGPPPFSVSYDTTLATDDIGVPCGVTSGPFNNVWHTVTGTGNTITLTSCNGGTTHPDTKISVFCGECLELVCVTGNDDNCPGGGPIFASTVSFCSQAGIQYLVTTGGFAPGQVGVVQLDASDDGVPCSPDVQCLPQGACCLPDGSCVVATISDCAAQDGTYQGDGTECDSNAIVDGGFEAGIFGGTWNESSTNFGTPLCDAGCGFGGGTGPNSGTIWAWFGGIPAFEEGAVSQAVTIPLGATNLDFFLEIPVSSGNGVDFLEVTVDGIQEYLVLENAGPFVGYVLQQVDISAYADGGVHTIEFHSIITGAGGDFSNFFVDDVAINSTAIACPQPLGACCLADGSCVEVTEEDCAALSGMYNGDFSLCMDVECPQPFDCFVLDFETDDSGAGIAHGARVNTEFDGGANYPVTITGSALPTLANTAAILNSTTGPATQDPDLLVGCGNILILQNDGNQALCGPDTYCTHNDDEDGGSLSLVFNVPTEPSSLVLVDIDATDGVTTVVLTNDSGATRTYTVPANWTGDLITDATSGKGTLDLTTLANQAGYASVATASETPGFDPTQVRRIDVNLGGSGAVDDVSWCQPSM